MTLRDRYIADTYGQVYEWNAEIDAYRQVGLLNGQRLQDWIRGEDARKIEEAARAQFDRDQENMDSYPPDNSIGADCDLPDEIIHADLLDLGLATKIDAQWIEVFRDAYTEAFDNHEPGCAPCSSTGEGSSDHAPCPECGGTGVQR